MPHHRGFIDVHSVVKEKIDDTARTIEQLFGAHLLTYIGPIREPADALIRRAVETRLDHEKGRLRRSRRIVVILETGGGSIETAERIANTLRKQYAHVAFVVPDHAMSAGTVLAMSGDQIWMDYFSILGPIDPQVKNRNGQWVPALGYLQRYKALLDKSQVGGLSDVEVALALRAFDQGDLYLFQQAKDLSIELLEEWLVRYKFKDWKWTKSRRLKVTKAIKKARAKEIGEALSSPERWKSHGRGLSKDVLWKKLKLEIDDLDKEPQRGDVVRAYCHFVQDYLDGLGRPNIIHAGENVFLPWGATR